MTITKTHLILLFFCVSVSCQSPSQQETTSTQTANDTIQTASGLRYFYLKKGEGRKVEKGSKLKTKLSLMVDDSVVWTSYEAKDSTFDFIAGVSSVIKGFEEMAFLMREGDNVMVILPDSLAYGEKGAGDVIPPFATLVYDRYEIVSVSEPKLSLGDTLLLVLADGGVQQVMEVYDQIRSSPVGDSYHMEIHHLGSFLSQLMREEKYEEVEELAKNFEALASTEDDQWTFQYYRLRSTESQEKYEEALQVAYAWWEDDPDSTNTRLVDKIKELEGKLRE